MIQRRSRFAAFLAVGILVSSLSVTASAQDVKPKAGDWPWWRGPTHNGIAAEGEKPPVEWSAKKNIVWRALVPGRGHGSPIVVGDQVLLATADHQHDLHAVYCYDRKTGNVAWKTVVHEGGVYRGGNKKASQASTTMACDGERLYVSLLNKGAIHTTALDRSGKKLWQTKITKYIVHQGYGASPLIYKSLLIVSADNKGSGVVVALDRKNGEQVWRNKRPKKPNYVSPVIVNVGGRQQLVLTGCDLVSSFNPLTGKKLWEIAGATTECVTSTVTDGKHIYSSGGYPKNHVAAIRADGSGKIVWEQKERVYVPSMLIHNGYLYAVADRGIAICFKSDTGKVAWKKRLGGTTTASLVLADGNLFATNEKGKTFVYKANPKKFEQVAVNQLGDHAMASMAIAGGQIFTRVAEHTDGKRQEVLYCIGKKAD
jgi:hypothetical protein